MNDDYLWDKSGPPDPQIQQLEEILGTLRYQPKPFEIPREVPAPRRRSYFPLLAIAATLLVALLAGGIWLRVRTNSNPMRHDDTATGGRGDTGTRGQGDGETRGQGDRETQSTSPGHRVSASPRLPVSPSPHLPVSASARRLSRREREEAFAVKEQLMFALRLASEKINLAHRRTQSTTPANQIRNQHRVG